MRRTGWALALTLGACGQDDGGDDPPATIEAFAVRYADAACEVLRRCLGPFDFEGGACDEDGAAELLEDEFGRIAAAIARGTSRYDADRAAACIAAVRDIGCEDDFAEVARSCGVVFVGSAADGEPCEIDEECRAGSFCDTNDACPGACAPRVAEGGDCDEAACALGLECGHAGRCEAPARAGEACGGGEDERGCGGLLGCVEDAATGAGTCRAPTFDAGEGEACQPENGAYCAAGLACVAVDRRSKPSVWRCEAPVAAGAPCRESRPSMCPAGHECVGADFERNTPGTCVRQPREGEACGDGDADPWCAGELECHDGRCRALAAVGEACDGDDACRSFACEAGRCVVPACDG